MKTFYISLYCIVAILLILYILYFRRHGTLFTCTTFFDYEKEDKWKAFCQGMDSILAHHSPETLNRISKWLIVNEYSVEPKADWQAKLSEKYPFMVLLQKGADQKGQSASLNLILEEVSHYEYWIQWEEAWHTNSECLARAFAIMDSTEITQLQMTQVGGVPNWLDIKDRGRLHCQPDYCSIAPPANVNEMRTWDAHRLYNYPAWKETWPLFSLCPSINRASFYRIGPFDTDPTLWPIKFEWEYGRRWLERGGVKAVLPDGPVQQNKEHRSTYS